MPGPAEYDVAPRDRGVAFTMGSRPQAKADAEGPGLPGPGAYESE